MSVNRVPGSVRGTLGLNFGLGIDDPASPDLAGGLGWHTQGRRGGRHFLAIFHSARATVVSFHPQSLAPIPSWMAKSVSTLSIEIQITRFMLSRYDSGEMQYTVT